MEALSHQQAGSDHADARSATRRPPGIAAAYARLIHPITLDLRSLAVLRLSLALILLFHLSTGLIATLADPTEPNYATAALFTLGLPIALLLLAGYRSRLVAVLSLLVVLAVNVTPAANPPFDDFTLGPGAAALALVLFMAALLPIGVRYSLDSVVNTTPPTSDRHTSLASLGLIALFIAVNLGPNFWTPPNPFAGPPEIAAADASTTQQQPLGGRTLTAAHLRTVPWLPAAIPTKISLAIVFALVLLLVPIFQGVLRGAATIIMAGLHLIIAVDFAATLLALVLAATWLALAPPGLWDALFARLRTPARLGVTIWYHGSDPAHLRRVRILATFLLIPDTQLRPTHENVDIDVYRRQRDSWVVTDHLGYRYNRFRAFAAICRASPLVFPLGVIFRSAFVEPVGDWFYDFGKRHRGPLTRLADALNFRSVPARIPVWQHLVAFFILAFVLAWRLPPAA